ncbi:hypothetical protein ACFV42_01670 [Streptomyces solisilvae]
MTHHDLPNQNSANAGTMQSAVLMPVKVNGKLALPSACGLLSG